MRGPTTVRERPPGRADSVRPRIPGGLYVVSTPIGNMGDITARAVETLAGADLVACEDTRRTGLLLQHCGVSARLVSYHEYNKLRRTPELLEALRHGGSVALVTDAGTPGISDPGFYLIRAAVEAGLRVVAIPGASALLTALVVSGLPSDRFAFEGFLPKRDGRRRKRLLALKDEERTMVFYESARRVGRLTLEMLELWGERKVVIGRELTKKFEEVIRGTLADVSATLAGRELKGETVVVVAGAGEEQGRAEAETEGGEIPYARYRMPDTGNQIADSGRRAKPEAESGGDGDEGRS